MSEDDPADALDLSWFWRSRLRDIESRMQVTYETQGYLAFRELKRERDEILKELKSP